MQKYKVNAIVRFYHHPVQISKLSEKQINYIFRHSWRPITIDFSPKSVDLFNLISIDVSKLFLFVGLLTVNHIGQHRVYSSCS